jgi:glycogen debranching enzyme
VSKPENLEGPDLNSMLVMEAFSLSQMAKELKLDRDAVYYLDRARKLADRINNQLWDDETGFYYNTLLSSNSFIFLHKNDLKIKEIIGFLPLWANVCTPDRAKILIQSLANPEEFWRPFGIPTLSAKDPYYNPMGYWNGPVWIEWQYLVFRGLLDYGYKPLARVLADRIIDQMIWHLKNDHTFWEFYSPDDRQAGWNKTYIWAGLVARMMLDMESAQ